MRTAEVNASLLRTISAARLSRYLSATDGDLEMALAAYERNIRISEAFYTPLQALEVCLRNALHDAMSARWSDRWLLLGGVPLQTQSLTMIADARRAFAMAGRTPTADDLVAELKFAFWVGLLGPGYDSTLWRQALFVAFSKQSGRRRSVIHGRFNAIRRLRNRIAHHEPITWRDTIGDHAEILEAIGWMSIETRDWVAGMSRVPTAFGQTG